ncbi:MAG: hypothetical protein ACK5LN_10535 [Propioniciclava sp.]
MRKAVAAQPPALASGRLVALLPTMWVIPAILTFALGWAANVVEQQAVEPALPDYVTVGRAQGGPDAAVLIEVAIGEERPLKGRASGTVTRLGTAVSGDTIVDGQPLLQIDGRWIIANAGVIPFHRTLRLGDSGDDVLRLNELLKEQSLAAPDGARRSRFTAATQRGVQKLNEQLGVAGVAFEPSATVFVGPQATLLSREVNLGDVVSEDQTLMTAVENPKDVRVLHATEQVPVDAPDGDWQIVAASGDTFTHPADSEALDGAALATFGLRFGVLTEGESNNGSQSSLTLTGFTMEMTNPEEPVGVVPATSIFTNGEGRVCVFELSAEGSVSAVPLHRVTAGQQIGVVHIDAVLIGRQVVRDAVTVTPEAERTC